MDVLDRKLQAYNLKDIQSLIHILTECEVEGITDVRFVRVRLEERVRQKVMKKRQKNTQPPEEQHYHECPECGKTAAEKLEIEGLHLLVCKACRYSEVIE